MQTKQTTCIKKMAAIFLLVLFQNKKTVEINIAI